VAQFVQASVLTQDFASVANTISPLAASIRNAFGNSNDENNLYVAEYADLIVSVMARIALWMPLNNNTNLDTPAFSEGLFRIDGIIEWIKTQGSSGPDLRTAGVLCNQFLIQLGNINWSGFYNDRNGQRVSWDANNDIRSFVGDVQPVCLSLSQLAFSP